MDISELQEMTRVLIMETSDKLILMNREVKKLEKRLELFHTIYGMLLDKTTKE